MAAELATKFHIDVVTGAADRPPAGTRPGAWRVAVRRYRHIIVSTDFIKASAACESFWHGCPDLLIIDEAHTCVNDSDRGRSRMLRHELVSHSANDRARHLILVTATPHSGKEEAFRDLLALLGDTCGMPTSNHPRACAPCRALRAAPPRRHPVFLGDTPFPQDRHSKELPYELGPEYKDLFADVLAYARESVQDPGGGPVRQRVRYWSALALLRALAPHHGRHRSPFSPGQEPRRR